MSVLLNKCCNYMVISRSQTLKKIEGAASLNDSPGLKKIINAAILDSERRDRRELLREINRMLMETAIKKNNPGIIVGLEEIPDETIVEYFPKIVKHYIRTRDETWLQTLSNITDRLERKSNQSRMFAILTRMLIETGVSESNPVFIGHGLQTLGRITFKKYRSEIMGEIVPPLMSWAIKTTDISLLHTVYSLIEDIGDISKRSLLQDTCAQSVAAVALAEKRTPLLVDSIRFACTIRQKTRRETCILSIIDTAVATSPVTIPFDIADCIHLFDDFSEEIRLEIIDPLLKHLINEEKNHKTLLATLDRIAENLPFSQKTIVTNLLKKANRDGDIWYFSTALEIQNRLLEPATYPIREIVKAGISIAEQSGTMKAFTLIVPMIEKTNDPALSSRIFIQMTQVMLSQGRFKDALELYAKIDPGLENLPHFDDCSIALFKQSVMNDNVPLVKELLEKKPDKKIYLNTISRAITDICKNYSFTEISRHIDSMTAFIFLHPHYNQIIFESVSILTNRGFLEGTDPTVLIKFTAPVSDRSIKERALSMIVIKLAKLGVKTKNRDHLQRAVGLTCLIEEEQTRSATLTSIIDEATVLAVLDGDLDLLMRMREWSSSLLSPDVEIFAIAKIIDGIITYAIDMRYPTALEEAYRITQDIHDPSLNKELLERICECFVTIGCLLVEDQQAFTQLDHGKPALIIFERSLELLIRHGKSEERSLKIANLIDIILGFLQKDYRPYYLLPLVLYSLKIENPLERHAMVSRIVSNIKMAIESVDSTDPYEILVNHLERIEYIHDDPELLGIMVRAASQIRDPFARLSYLSSLAGSYIRLDNPPRAAEILTTIHSSLDQVSDIYQKVLILSDLIRHYARVSEDSARKHLREALHLVSMIDYDRESVARKLVVIALARLQERTQDQSLTDLAVDVISRIRDPIEYTDAMMYVYGMVRGDQARRNDIIIKISEKCDTITSPAQKASVLLDIVPFIIHEDDNEMAFVLLKHVALVARSIRISSIADSIRGGISNAYFIMFEKSHDEKAKKTAVECALEINNEETRTIVLNQIGHEGIDRSSHYTRIKEYIEKISKEGYGSGTLDALERMIRSDSHRGKVVQHFCNAAVLLKNYGKNKMAKRMVDAAIGEAGIIRPLSRRAYVFCDIALILHSAGCEVEEHAIIDMAVNTAANIRQFHVRDEVFDNLAYAMRYMQVA
jgi:hypothetical protein